MLPKRVSTPAAPPASAARAPRPRLAWLVLALATLLSTTLAGCFNPFDPRVFREGGTVSAAPSPTSPENTLLLLKWCWTNRAPDLYEEIFTDDYEFVFGALDSTGNAYRDGKLYREDEVISFRNLCNGGGSEPPATSISLTFDPSLNRLPDLRPGHKNKWHYTILTSVALTVRTESQSYETQGRGLYFFVRGDSAAIPASLAQRGFVKDSTRWWVDRWEDQTVSNAGGGLLAALERDGNPRVVSVEMRITPEGEWREETPAETPKVVVRPLARPTVATGTEAGGSKRTSAAVATDFQQVSFGFIKSRFLRLR